MTVQVPTARKSFYPNILIIQNQKASWNRENEETWTTLIFYISLTIRTNRVIQKPAWGWDYDISVAENYNFAIAASVNGDVHINLDEAVLSTHVEKWQAA